MIKPSEQELEKILEKYRNNPAKFMYDFTNLFTDHDGSVQELYPKQIEFMNLIPKKDKIVAVVKSRQCIPGYAKVMTDIGELPIERIVNMDPKPSVFAGVETKLCKVKNGWFSGTKRTFDVYTSSGRMASASADHKFATVKKDKLKWVKLQDLKVGDPVYFLRSPLLGAELCEITSIVDTGRDEGMYDLEVESEHSFFVGGVLVHNCGITTSIIGKTIHSAYFGKVPATLICSAGQRQSIKVLDKIKKAINSMPDFMRPKLKRETNEEIVFESGAEITSLPNNPDTSRGYSGDVIMDEFGVLDKKTSEAMWEAVYPSTIKGWRLTCVSSPKGVDNVFYQLCNPKLDNNGKNISAYQADRIINIHWTDVPHVAKAVKEERMMEKIPAKAFTQEYCCEFVSDDESSFFDIDTLNDKVLKHDMHFDKIGTLVQADGTLIPTTQVKTDIIKKYEKGIYVGYDPATTTNKYLDASVVTVLGQKIDGVWEMITMYNFPVGTSMTDQVAFVIRTAKAYQANMIGLDASGGFGLTVYELFKEADYGHKIVVHKFTSEFKFREFSYLRNLMETDRFKMPASDPRIYDQFSKLGFNPVTNKIAAIGRSTKDDIPCSVICALACKSNQSGFEGFDWL